MGDRVPELEALPHGVVLDGELVAFNEAGAPHWPLVCNRVLHGDTSIRITFVAFDVLRVDGHDLTRSTWEKRRAVLEELTERDKLSLEAVTYLRGRTLHGTFVLVDEAQNLEPTTLKTILTRVGEGTKVVFTGDTSQIDAPYLGESNNALAVLTAAFAGQSCFGHITMTACERSDVASLAAELL